MRVEIDAKILDLDSEAFNLELTWTRVAAWRLWRLQGVHPAILLGGTHDSNVFRVFDGKKLLHSNVPGIASKPFKIVLKPWL